jgi:hypothetical protein
VILDKFLDNFPDSLENICLEKTQNSFLTELFFLLDNFPDKICLEDWTSIAYLPRQVLMSGHMSGRIFSFPDKNKKVEVCQKRLFRHKEDLKSKIFW